jgi:hypothetical protein
MKLRLVKKISQETDLAEKQKMSKKKSKRKRATVRKKKSSQ